MSLIFECLYVQSDTEILIERDFVSVTFSYRADTLPTQLFGRQYYELAKSWSVEQAIKPTGPSSQFSELW